MIDAPKEILDYLLSQSGLTELTSTRIWSERDTPPPDYDPADGGAIALRRRGGTHDYEAVVLEPSFQFKCYGADEVTANAVYRALWDALNQQSTYRIKIAEEETQGQTLREPVAGWCYVLVFYRLQITN